MRIVLDENVSLSLAGVLRADGHEVTSMAESPSKGMADGEVWSVACGTQSLLITRDYHFTNPVRFDPARCLGIVFVKHGNLRAGEEIKLVRAFVDSHPLEEYQGRLVTLFPGSTRIRPSLSG